MSEWVSARLPIEKPDAVWQRLLGLEWRPVALHGLPYDDAENPVYASFEGEKFLGTWEKVQKKSAAQRVGEEVGLWGPSSIIGGLIGEAVLGGIGRAIGGGQKWEYKRVWKPLGHASPFVTARGLYARQAGAWKRMWAVGVEATQDPTDAIQLLLKQNELVQYRTQNATLLSLVLRTVVRDYATRRLGEKATAWKATADGAPDGTAGVDAVRVARAFREMDYADGAAEYFEKAAKSPDKEIAAESLNALGNMWTGYGYPDRGRAAYVRAVEFGETANFVHALCNLGNNERCLGNIEAAYGALERVAEMHHPEASVRARYLLAVLFNEDLKDKLRGRQMYEEVMRSGQPEWSSPAAYYGGMIMAEQKDFPAAVAALNQAVQSGNKEYAPRAALMLGKWYGETWKDPATGRRFLEEAVAFGHDRYSREAGELLATKRFQISGAPG